MELWDLHDGNIHWNIPLQTLGNTIRAVATGETLVLKGAKVKMGFFGERNKSSYILTYDHPIFKMMTTKQNKIFQKHIFA